MSEPSSLPPSRPEPSLPSQPPGIVQRGAAKALWLPIRCAGILGHGAKNVVAPATWVLAAGGGTVSGAVYGATWTTRRVFQRVSDEKTEIAAQSALFLQEAGKQTIDAAQQRLESDRS